MYHGRWLVHLVLDQRPMAQWPMHHKHNVELFNVVPPHRRSRRTIVSTLLNNRWVHDLVRSLTLSVLIQYLLPRQQTDGMALGAEVPNCLI
jgi:hypothetical protein